MKLLKKLTIPLLITMSCFLIFSCSKDLTRDEAKDLIIKKYGFPKYESNRFYKEYLQVSINQGVRDWKGGSIRRNFPENLNSFYKSGLITIGEKHIQRINNWDGRVKDWLVYTVTLTNEGEKYLINESENEYEVKTCVLSFGEITGIQMQKQANGASANYTIIRKATPFGFNVSQGSENRTTTFSLFDDGWRIE
jgi:hypothetical protein